MENFLRYEGLQNGAPDGFALVKDETDEMGETVVQFLSYEGSFTAVDGKEVLKSF